MDNNPPEPARAALFYPTGWSAATTTWVIQREDRTDNVRLTQVLAFGVSRG
jgi:hypothetical protein